MIIKGYSAILAVETGHGKSIKVENICDMIALSTNKLILVVCLNDFLAFWSQVTYGSVFVDK